MLSIIELNHLFRDKQYLTGLKQSMNYVTQLKKQFRIYPVFYLLQILFKKI